MFVKKYNKKILATVILTICFSFFSFSSVLAAGGSMTGLLKTAGETGAGFAPAGPTTFSSQLGKIIQYLLSFLGVVFVILIIYGGFRWMLARGDDQEVTVAKEIMRDAIIGLVIVLAAYVITTSIMSGFGGAVGGGGKPPSGEAAPGSTNL